MRLSLILWRKKMPNGHIWRGKHKLLKQVTPLIFAETKRKLEIEEKNLFFLRHPYLSLEQDRGHAKALGKHDKWLAEKKANQIMKFRPHVTLEERLSHLKVTEAWD